jgi:apolipoprotein N-acyltransferase
VGKPSESRIALRRSALDRGRAVQYIDPRSAQAAERRAGRGERVDRRTKSPGRGRSELICLLGGACIALGFPPSPIFPLLFLGLGLFLREVRGASPGRGLRLGLIFGLALEAGGFYWLAGTVARFYRIFLTAGEGGSELALALGIGAFLIWWLFAALAWGLWGVAIALSPRHPVARISWVVVSLVTLEALFPRVFPWNFGAGFAMNPWFAQGAWWVGVAGLSAAAVLVSACFAEAVDRPRGEKLRFLFPALVLLAIWGSAGAMRHRGSPPPTGTTLRIGFVQSAISLERRHARDERTRGEVFAEIERRSRALFEAESPDVVVWSEGMLPDVAEPREIGRWAQTRLHCPIIIGGLGVRGGRSANRAFIAIDPGGRVEFYDKRFLVPFGEKIPFRGLLEGLGVPIPSQEIVSGDAPLVVPIRGVPVSFSICFEGILGVTAPSLREVGARLHINLTEDLWYGDTSAPRQHLALARMRAVEAGLPLIRVTNGGISASCDERGRLLEKVDMGGPVSGVFEISVPDRLAPAPPTQGWLARLPLLFAPLAFLGLFERRRGASGRGRSPDPRAEGVSEGR